MIKRILLVLVALLFLLLTLPAILFFRSDIPLEKMQERWTYPESDFLQIDSMPVHYRVTGSGPAFVLLHGTGASLHTWEEWTNILSPEFRVISLDLPAFGLTGPHPEADYSIDSYVAFLENFSAALGLDTFFLAGNSLGGHIAWAYTCRHPERVKKLVLLDPSGKPRQMSTAPRSIRLAQHPLWSRLLLRITPKNLFRQSLLEVYHDDEKVTPELVNRYFQLFLREGNRQAFIDRSATVSSSNSECLKELNIPVLIQWGEADTWIPLAHAQWFAGQLPNSTVITYPNVGHVPMEEAPLPTARDAMNWLLENITD